MEIAKGIYLKIKNVLLELYKCRDVTLCSLMT